MKRRLTGMIRKEFMHIVRDRQTLLIVIAMPTLMLLLYGYAISLDLKEIKTEVIDYDHSQSSRQLIHALQGNAFFSLQETVTSRQTSIADHMRQSATRLALTIPQGYEQQLASHGRVEIIAHIDGIDPNTANLIYFYTTAFFISQSNGVGQSMVQLEPRFLYNHNLEASYFFVPGLVAFIMIMLTALLTAITVSRERETGTMEQLLVSPLRPWEIILGKTIPYLLLALAAEILILTFGFILFALPLRGSAGLLFAASLLFLSTGLAIGILASTIAKTQQVAMFVALFATLLPTIILSGFIFPLESMWIGFRYFSQLIPAKYFITIIRAILLKGNDFSSLIIPFAGLSILQILFLSLSINKFSIYLEK
jgi:ABC-2 type transport system permease protein